MRAMTPKAARNSRSKSSVSGTLATLPRQAHRHAIAIDGDVILAAHLGPICRVGTDPIAAPLGPHRATVQDQGGIAAQHRHQQRMHLAQHRVLGPEGQEPPQGRATGLLDSGAQAAPRQAVTQEPAQGGNHTHDLTARMARSALRWWFARHDEVRNQVQKSEIQHVLPYPDPQTWEAKAPFPAKL